MSEPPGIAAQQGVLSMERDAVGAALGKVPSGCAILTVQNEHYSTGVLISWFQQASFDPPSVSVALKKGRPAAVLVEQSGKFLLNLISSNPTPMFKHFGRGFGLDEDAFQGLETEPTAYGRLIRSCIGHMGCTVSQKVAVGDHDLYVATIDCALTAAGGQVPYIHTRNSGFSY